MQIQEATACMEKLYEFTDQDTTPVKRGLLKTKASNLTPQQKTGDARRSNSKNRSRHYASEAKMQELVVLLAVMLLQVCSCRKYNDFTAHCLAVSGTILLHE